MNAFKLRAEGQCDADALMNALGDNYADFMVEQASIDGVPIPDVDIAILSPLSLDEIRDIIRTIPDSHVMLQTVQLEQDYTGERDYDLQ